MKQKRSAYLVCRLLALGLAALLLGGVGLATLCIAVARAGGRVWLPLVLGLAASAALLLALWLWVLRPLPGWNSVTSSFWPAPPLPAARRRSGSSSPPLTGSFGRAWRGC